MKKTWSKLLALALALVLCLSLLPAAALAFNPDNYKANITKVSIGAPLTDANTGKKYLPVTVYFTAGDDLGDRNAVEFLEGYLKATLADGQTAEGISGLGMTLIGPLKPDALDGAGSNAFSWEWSEGSGSGVLKYNIPLLDSSDTQSVEHSDATGQDEVNGLKVGDKVTLQNETVFNTERIPESPVKGNEFTFIVEDTSHYPKEITTSEGGGSGGNTCDHVGTEREYESPGKGYSFHYVICVKCRSEVSKEDHVFGDPVKGNGDVAQYTRTCTKCGYVETVNCTHNGTFTYKDPNDSTHIKVCDICGKYIVEPHRLDNYAYENEQNHFRTCMDCLKRFTEPHTWKRKWPRYEKDGFSYRFYFTQTCKQCGAVAEGYVTGNPFGYRIISDWADVDEYSTLDWMFSRINSSGGMTKADFEAFMAGRYDISAFSRGWVTVVGPLTSLITAMGGRADVNSMNYIRTCMDYSFLDGKPVKLEVVQTSANNAQNTNQNTNQNVNRNVNSNVVQNSLLRANGNLSLFQQSVQVNNLRQMANSTTTEDFFDEEKNDAQWIDLRGNYTLTYLPFNTIQALEDGEHSIMMIFTGEDEDGKEVLCPYTVRFEVYSVEEDTVPVKHIRNARPEGEMYCGGANAFLTVAPQEAEYTGSAIEPTATVIAYRRVYKDGAYVIESDTLVEGKDYSLTVYRTDNDATMPVEEIKEVGEYVVVATPVEGSEWKGEAWATFTVTPVESTPSYIGGGTTTYTATLTDSPHGRVTVSPTSAAKGETVKITATPDEGCELDALTVTDTGGKEIALTKNADGTFSFVQPAGKVTIKATFKKTADSDENCPMKAFIDLDPAAWYHDGVHWALENGIMNGVGDGKFDPSGATTRGMIVTILYRLEGEPVIRSGMPFSDVKESDWYAKAISWAESLGIVNGYGDGRFGPNDPVTREQLAAILYRYAQSKGQGFKGLWNFKLDFPDAGEVSVWAIEAVSWMVMNGVVGGKDGKLVPGGNASRAEAATMLQRFSAKIAE